MSEGIVGQALLSRQPSLHADVQVEMTIRFYANKDYVDEYKSTNPCHDCGHFFPAYVMQFDHVIGNKLFNIADMVYRGRSLESLKVEISKCELVCSNCHAIRTHHRRVEKRSISSAS